MKQGPERDVHRDRIHLDDAGNEFTYYIKEIIPDGATDNGDDT